LPGSFPVYTVCVKLRIFNAAQRYLWQKFSKPKIVFLALPGGGKRKYQDYLLNNCAANSFADLALYSDYII